MQILKKRSTATAVLAAVIVIFTVIGINRSVARVSSRVEKAFYEGVYLEDEGYTEKSVYSHLVSRERSAMGLLSLISGDDTLASEADALRSARSELASAVTVSEYYAANERLESAYKALRDALPADIASSEAAQNYLSGLSGAQAAIEKSAYNEAAQEADDSLLGGVLYPLRLLVFTDYPEGFSS